MRESNRIMFLIYRDESYTRDYRVVYFTELGEHDKDKEINRALAGEHFYDGFIKENKKEEAKGIIAQIVNRLNEGEALPPGTVPQLLAGYTPE